MKVRETIVREWDAQGLGAKINTARMADSRSVQALAKAAGISRGYWYELENENIKGAVEVETLRAIEDVLGVDLLDEVDHD